MGQASFKFDKKEGAWSRVQKVATATASKEGEVIHLEEPSQELSTTDKVFVLLSSMIKDLSRNMNDHYLGMAKQIQRLDEKVDELKKQVEKVEETARSRDKRLREFHLNPLEQKINDLIEDVANLQRDDTEEVVEEEVEKLEEKTV